MYNYIGIEPRREAMHWQFGEMEFGEMKRNTSNWSNFGMLLRRAGFTSVSWAFLFVLVTTRKRETQGKYKIHKKVIYFMNS